jgi:hypothetical protein
MAKYAAACAAAFTSLGKKQKVRGENLVEHEKISIWINNLVKTKKSKMIIHNTTYY